MIGVLGYRGLLGSTICRLHRSQTAKLPFISQRGLEEILKAHPFDTIINCLGVVPNSARQQQMEYVNGYFPVWLSERCTKYNIRLLHISTDCVFSGKAGAYVESDTPDPTTPYGLSKANGEVLHTPHLVVRTSFVGYPDPGGRGLFAWLVGKAGQTVRGYRQAYWNGLTVDTLADILVDLAPRERVWGLRHIFNTKETTTKYELLRMANRLYDLKCFIMPVDFPSIDRTLSTNHDDIVILYRQQLNRSYAAMLSEMENRLGRE